MAFDPRGGSAEIPPQFRPTEESLRLDEAFGTLGFAEADALETVQEPAAAASEDSPLSPDNGDTDIHGNDTAAVGAVTDHARKLDDTIAGYAHLANVTGGEVNQSLIISDARLTQGGDGGDARNRRQREQAARDFATQLMLIDQQIARLERLIEQNNERIDELEDQLSAIDRLEALGDNLDPTNPEHARLLRAAGIDPATVDPDNPQAALSRRRGEINGEIERLERENEQHRHRIEELQVERAQVETQIEQGRALETEIAAAPTATAVERIVDEASLADTAAALAQSDSDEVIRDIHGALDLTETQTDERLGMEDFASSDDLSFLMDDPPAPIVSAATEFGDDTPVNDGEGVQPMFERAVAGDVVPPGVEPEVPAPEQHPGTDQTLPDQTITPT